MNCSLQPKTLAQTLSCKTLHQIEVCSNSQIFYRVTQPLNPAAGVQPPIQTLNPYPLIRRGAATQGAKTQEKPKIPSSIDLNIK